MKKKIIPVVIAALIAAGLVFAPSMVAGLNGSASGAGHPGKPGPGGKPDGENASVFAVKTENAEIRSLQAYIEVNGDIVSDQQVTVVPEAAGKLVSMNAVLGQTVRKGQLLAQVDPSRPGAAYNLSSVYAPVSGVVASTPAAVGSTVSAGAALLVISSAGSLEIEARIPEREVGQLRLGLQAEVRLEAFPGETFAAELVRLSPLVDPVSRTKKIALRFTKDDPRINAGMFARIKLNTRSYENVVSIPQEAVQEKRGTPVVYVINTGGDVTAPTVAIREVQTGVSVDGEVEITGGLEAGEAVVVQGQQFLTDGAAVRILGRS
jgi:multidrug efflux pump subunit AcrA (membrane-fusion protein)